MVWDVWTAGIRLLKWAESGSKKNGSTRWNRFGATRWTDSVGHQEIEKWQERKEEKRVLCACLTAPVAGWCPPGTCIVTTTLLDEMKSARLASASSPVELALALLTP